MKDLNQFQNTFINTLYADVLNYTGEFVYVRHELKEYVNNDFRSTEKIRYDKTMFWTRLGFLIAFFGVIASIFLSVCSRTKINDQQHRELIEAVDKIEESIINASIKVAIPENVIDTIQLQ